MNPEAEPKPLAPRILVVEDEASLRQSWVRLLGRWGLVADQAGDGRQALERARHEAYELVITDLGMPVMSGQDLVRQLKAEQPAVEIIVTTGQATIETAVEMMKAGAYDFISKPIDFESAERIVRKCLEHIEANRENVRLRAENRDLEELNRLKEKFIAITGHELRTPVTIISNVIDLLEPVLASSEEEPLLRMVHNAAERLREIVDEMHEISQLNSGRIPLRRVPVELAGLFRELAEEQRGAAGERRHRITWEAPGSLGVSADRVKLRKVLRELVQNAIKFTPDGGDIAVTAEHNGEGCVIAVTDNGVGIPAAEHGRIFQLFYEVSDAMHHHSSGTAFQGGGMGVGLALVDDIVAAHGGRVRVESEPGRGSRFVITLPDPAAVQA